MSGARGVNGEKKKPNVALFWLSVLVIIAVFGVYRIVVMLVEGGEISPVWFSVLMWVYMLAACADFITVIVLQRGFSGKPLTADMLPDTMSIPEKTSFLKSDRRRKKIAKYFLVLLVALIFVFMYEIIELYYLPAIRNWFDSF